MRLAGNTELNPCRRAAAPYLGVGAKQQHVLNRGTSLTNVSISYNTFNPVLHSLQPPPHLWVAAKQRDRKALLPGLEVPLQQREPHAVAGQVGACGTWRGGKQQCQMHLLSRYGYSVAPT